jgi:hypothetical protein
MDFFLIQIRAGILSSFPHVQSYFLMAKIIEERPNEQRGTRAVSSGQPREQLLRGVVFACDRKSPWLQNAHPGPQASGKRASVLDSGS